MQVRRRLGIPYWSFSLWAKLRVKQAVNFINEFQRVVAEEARRQNVDGVICGHIHHATVEDMDGSCYINSSDWVESCTAIAEEFDGEMQLLRWSRPEVDRRNSTRGPAQADRVSDPSPAKAA